MESGVLHHHYFSEEVIVKLKLASTSTGPWGFFKYVMFALIKTSINLGLGVYRIIVFRIFLDLAQALVKELDGSPMPRVGWLSYATSYSHVGV